MKCKIMDDETYRESVLLYDLCSVTKSVGMFQPGYSHSRWEKVRSAFFMGRQL